MLSVFLFLAVNTVPCASWGKSDSLLTTPHVHPQQGHLGSLPVVSKAWDSARSCQRVNAMEFGALGKPCVEPSPASPPLCSPFPTEYYCLSDMTVYKMIIQKVWFWCFTKGPTDELVKFTGSFLVWEGV